MELRASSIIDPVTEGHFALFTFAQQLSTKMHQHDFYEIFLIIDGRIYHHINGERLTPETGALVFIRPNDAHFYEPYPGSECQIINLAFLRSTFDNLSGYLRLAQVGESLLTSRLPPITMLNPAERILLNKQMRLWGHQVYHEREHASMALRALLAQVVSGFVVFRAGDYPPGTPAWLAELCERMRHQPYIVEGRTALMRLTNRSPEHVARAFKAYLGQTPSEFINTLRLDYAHELLLHTDHPVTTICYDVGFENLSYFYRLFKARWGHPPQQFRRQNQRIPIP